MTELITNPIVVPVDFIGLHAKWPTTGTDYSGIQYGSIRTHDGSAPRRWDQIETSAGVYDFSGLDANITAYRQSGRTVSFVIYGTPAFYASATDLTHNDMYGVVGGAAYPTLDENLDGLRAFVMALVSRYNADDGEWRIANPTLGKGLASIEAGNEPDFSGTFKEFWWGSAAQLVDFIYTIYDAAKAVDQRVLVLSPGFNSWAKYETLLQAKGTLHPTICVKDAIDGLNTHIYFACAYGSPLPGFQADTIYGPLGVFSIKELGRKYGIDAPVYVSEWGWDFTSTTSQNSILREPPAVRYKALGRSLLMCAALGVKRVNLYQINNLAGDFTADTNGVKKAFNDVSQIVGKTLTSCVAQIGDSVTVKCSDGTVVAI